MKLTLQGFKAHDREIDLGRLNLFCAPNGSGKSAIADAVRFLALGRVPALGKTDSATALLMSGNELSVTLTLDDGRTATRTLRRNADKLETTVRASWARGSRAEHDAAILALFGSDVDDVAEQLDIRELLSLTPTKRAARMEKMIGSGATENLPRRVARTTIARLLDSDVKDLPEDLATSLQSLPAGRAEILRAIGATLTANLRENGMPPVIAWANEQKREAESKAKKRHAARDQLQERIRELGEAQVPIVELKAQRDQLHQAIGAHNELAKHEATRLRDLEKAQSELAQLEANLGDAIDKLDTITHDATAVIEELEKKPSEYDEKIGELKAKTWAPTPTSDRLKWIDQTLGNLVDEAVEDLNRYERTVQQLEDELAGVKASPWTEVKQIGEALIEKGGTGYGVRLVELADANGADATEVEKALTAARDVLKIAGDRAAAAAQKNMENAERREKLEIEARELRNNHEASQARVDRLRNDRDSEVTQFEEKKRFAVQAIADQRNRIEEQRTHVENLRTKYVAAKERVATLSEMPADVETPDAGELERLDTAIAAATTRESIKTELKTIIAEIDRLDAEVDVYRALEWALQLVRAEELHERGPGITATIANFLQAAGRPELPYLEAGKGICDIGWIREDRRKVSIEAMSGGEYSLFCAALTCAILAARGGDLKLLMVEAAECDVFTIEQLCGGIGAMEKLTNAIVLTAHPIRSDIIEAGWTQIEIEKVAA